MRKLRTTILAGLAGSVLSLAALTAASAAPATPAAPARAAVHLGNVGSHYSSAFAGFSTDDNGNTIYDGMWRQLSFPDESAAAPGSIKPDTVIGGMIMAANQSLGGLAVGVGGVLNDPASTCGNAYTLESGQGTVTLPTQPTLPASDLSPVISAGADVCIPLTGGTEFAYLYDSHHFNVVRVSIGPNSHQWAPLASLTVPSGTVFRVAGAGVSACYTGQQFCPAGDNAAAALVAGSSFDGSGVAFYINGQGNSVFGQGHNLLTQNYDNWEATVNGGAPTPVNPVVLNTSPATTLLPPYGSYSENVPA